MQGSSPDGYMPSYGRDSDAGSDSDADHLRRPVTDAEDACIVTVVPTRAEAATATREAQLRAETAATQRNAHRRTRRTRYAVGFAAFGVVAALILSSVALTRQLVAPDDVGLLLDEASREVTNCSVATPCALVYEGPDERGRHGTRLHLIPFRR